MAEKTFTVEKPPKKKVSMRKEQIVKEYYTCLSCGESQSKQNYYKNEGAPIGIIPICKNCVAERVLDEDDEMDKNRLKLLLKSENVNKPFITKYFESALNSKDKNKVGAYFKFINSGDMKKSTWADSDDLEVTPEKVRIEMDDEYVVQQPKQKKHVITKELIQKWGEGYTPVEYVTLEDLFNKFLQDFDIESKIQEEYFKNAIVAQMRNLQSLAKGDASGAEKWGKQFDSYMASGNLKPTQISALDKMGGVEDYSMFFSYVEKSEKFIPTFPDIILDDIDYAIFMFINYVRVLLGSSELQLGEVKDFMTYDYKRGQEIIFPTKVGDDDE